MNDAADEVVAERGDAELALLILEQVLGALPQRYMHVASIAGQMRERFWHEGRAHLVLFRDRLHHVFEERVAIRRDQGVIIFPVHFELAVGVFMVVLVRLPAELEHAVADLADDVIAPHQRGLVVTGLACRSALSLMPVPSGEIRKNSHSTPLLSCMPLSAAFAFILLSRFRGACSTGLPFIQGSAASQPTSGFQGS